jgi:DNA-binding Lrp family transcriptional regulator
MDTIDKKILNLIQNGFPIQERPFAVLADQIGLSEGETIHRIKELKKRGIIRRIGAIFDSRSLGYSSTLVAMRVPSPRIEEVAALVNCYPNVTHNYERDGEYNLWFTLIAESEERIRQIMGEIVGASGIQDILNLPAKNIFKIQVNFSFEEAGSREFQEVWGTEWQTAGIGSSETKDDTVIKDGASLRLSEEARESFYEADSGNRRTLGETETRNRFSHTQQEINLIRWLQGDLSIEERPFGKMAGKVGVGEKTVLDMIRKMTERGIIRRFGAVLNHQEAGYKHNAMGVWQVPARVHEVGAVMASFPQVSHCYERPRWPQWSYNVYTMIHGHSKEECAAIAERISRATGVVGYKLLFSVREFKKTSMEYFNDQ